MTSLTKSQSIALALAAPLLLASCGDDPELVRKRDEQRAETHKLQEELTVLRAELAVLPGDRSAELEELGRRVRNEEAETASLEREAAELSVRKREMTREFERYKKRYPLD